MICVDSWPCSFIVFPLEPHPRTDFSMNVCLPSCFYHFNFSFHFKHLWSSEMGLRNINRSLSLTKSWICMREATVPLRWEEAELRDYSTVSCWMLSWAGRLMSAKTSNASQHPTKVKHFLCISAWLGRGEICSEKKVRWNVKSRVIALEREILINSHSASSRTPCAHMNLSSHLPCLASEDTARLTKPTEGQMGTMNAKVKT